MVGNNDTAAGNAEVQQYAPRLETIMETYDVVSLHSADTPANRRQINA